VDTLAEDFDDSAVSTPAGWDFGPVDITCRHRQPVSDSASPRIHDERAAANGGGSFSDWP
jgi:hypothetical protein